MERLYAAVMAQEDQKSRTAVATVEVPSSQPATEQHDGHSRARRPLRLLTNAPHLAFPSDQASPTTPMTPRSSVRAIYPPDSYMSSMPNSPTSPIRAEYPTTPLTPSYQPQPASPRVGRETYDSSFGSQRSSGANNRRNDLRNLRIGPPIYRYPSSHEDDTEARTPLSPLFYLDPGAPPSPPPRSEAPTTPGTADGYYYEEPEELDRVQPLPRPAPQRMSSYNNHPAEAASSSEPARARVRAPIPSLIVPTKTANSSVNTLGTLPFRSNLSYVPDSPSAGLQTKTTLLSPRRDVFLTGPRTGMAIPYSPYMPFTPVTPVTPHLVGRHERKAREREAGRGVITEEDAVRDDKEMWGDAY
ncbi:hypothetical protein LTR28_006774 [Elasticomyces elasticus]|nr:hypothetical protein LTR28_006774 [Elasticomyces elasticus]